MVRSLSPRVLPIEARNEQVRAHPDFLLLASFNPGYQGLGKGLKPSTRQRFCAKDFAYPEAEIETAIVARESGVDAQTARRLVALGRKTRTLQDAGLEEGASARMLVHAGGLVTQGMSAGQACRMAVVSALTDDPDLCAALSAAVDAAF